MDHPWLDKVQQCAIAFASESRDSFKRQLAEAGKHLPTKDREYKLKQLEIFMEAVMSSSVAIIADFGGQSLQVEELVIRTIREKFILLRTKKAQEFLK